MSARCLFNAIPISTLFVLVALVSVAHAATTISTNIQTDGTLSVTGTSTLTGSVGVGTSTPWGMLSVTGPDTSATSPSFVAADSNNNPLFDVMDNGNVGIGTANPQATLDISTNGATYYETDTYRNSAFGGGLVINHARGTVTTPAALNSGDRAGSIFFAGYDGASFNNMAAIEAYADGTPVPNTSTPGRLVFSTTPVGAIFQVERMRITSAGNVGIGTTSPIANFQVANNNATTTMEIGSAGESKGSCLKLYRTDGSAIYAYVAAGATTFTLTTTACANVSNF
jgi:hypothetical protein